MNHDDRLRSALETLAKAVQEAGETISRSPAERRTDLEPSGPAGVFIHTDGHGDGVVMDAPAGGWSVLRVETTEDQVVLLDQDAVNRLAQYLDQHRTDGRHGEACEAPPEPVHCPWRYRRLSGRLDVCDRGGHEGSVHGVGEIKWYESADRAFKAGQPDETPESVVPGTSVPRMSKCGVCSHGAHGTDRCTATVQAFDADAGTCVCQGRAEDYRADPHPTRSFNAFYCAGWRVQDANPKAGCGHPRYQHGASGCNGDWRPCPCERRNGA